MVQSVLLSIIWGSFFCCFKCRGRLIKREQKTLHCFCLRGSLYMHASFCVCQWKAQVSAALSLLVHSIQTPRVWTACGALVPPTAHKHSCCCLPRWQWSGRLQPAGPHAVLSADTLSQLINMFCKRKFSGKTLLSHSQ